MKIIQNVHKILLSRLIHVLGHSLIIWLLSIIPFTLAINIFIPFYLVFHQYIQISTSIYYVGSTIVCIIFFLDILWQYIYIPSNKPQSPNKYIKLFGVLTINRKYIQTKFIYSCLLSIPFFAIADSIGLHTLSQYLILLYFIRSFQIIYTFLTIKLNFIKIPTRLLFLRSNIFGLINLGIIILYTAHIIACVWIYIHVNLEPNNNILTIYTDAFYWSLTTLTTVGYGDIVPTTTYEKLYTMFVMLIGVAIYAYMIGNIASTLSQTDYLKNARKEKLKNLNQFFKRNNIPFPLQHKVLNYYNYVWENSYIEEKEVIEEMPDKLQKEIELYLHRDLIEKFPLFRSVDNNILNDIILGLKEYTVLPKEYVIREGDIANSIFFIKHGRLAVRRSNSTQEVAILSDGDFFGETSILNKSEKRSASVLTLTHCHVYQLNKETFNNVIKKYPKFAAEVKRISHAKVNK